MRRRQSGFTLVEIVVAFVLLSLVMVTGFEIFSGGMRRAGDLEDRAQALVVAQSRLALAGLEQPLAEGQTQGESEDRRYRWTMSVAQFEETLQDPAKASTSAHMLMRVDVRVAWTGADQRERSLALATLGLAPRPQ